jgi:hypothetical protein
LLVVSSDKRLRRAARRCGARWLATPTFLSHLIRDAAVPAAPPARPEFAQRTPLDGQAVRFWSEQLGIEQDPELAALLDQAPDLPAELTRAATRPLEGPGGGNGADDPVVNRASRAGAGARPGARPNDAAQRGWTSGASGAAEASPRPPGPQQSAPPPPESRRRQNTRPPSPPPSTTDLESAMLRDLDDAMQHDPVLREGLRRQRPGSP